MTAELTFLFLFDGVFILKMMQRWLWLTGTFPYRERVRSTSMSFCSECRDRLDTEIEYVTAMRFGGSQDSGDGPGDNFFRPVKSMILNHVGSTPSGTGPSSCDMQT